MEMKRKKISVTSLILPVIMLVVAVVLPMIFSTNYYIQLFSQTLINLVAVLGLNVVMGLAGQTNLGTIALVALGSYTSALISQATGSTNLIGLLAALVVAVLVGFMLGYPSLRVSGIFLSLTTMSVAQIVYSLANSMQWLTGGAMGVKDISEPNIFGIEFKTQAQLYYFILVIAILLIIFSVRLAKSKYGRALKAVPLHLLYQRELCCRAAASGALSMKRTNGFQLERAPAGGQTLPPWAAALCGGLCAAGALTLLAGSFPVLPAWAALLLGLLLGAGLALLPQRAWLTPALCGAAALFCLCAFVPVTAGLRQLADCVRRWLTARFL